MRLGIKTFLVLSSVLSLSTALNFVVVQATVTPSFQTVEQNKAEQNLSRVISAIENEIIHLDRLAFDWSAWDDTYNFIVDQNDDYIESNLVWSSYANSELNLIHLYDPEGRLVWGESYDLASEEPLEFAELPHGDLAPDHPLLTPATSDRVDHRVAGIILTSAGPMLIASRPVITSEEQGPIRGALMMGRLLTHEVWSRLAEQVAVDFQAWPVAADEVPSDVLVALDRPAAPDLIRERGDDALDIFTTIAAVDGTPALVVRASTPRDITGIGRETIEMIFALLIGTGLVVTAITLLLSRHVVIGPITALTETVLSIGQTGDLSRRIGTAARHDEIGLLADEFDAMLGKLAEARDRVQQQSFQAGIAEMAAGVLHNVRNQLNPLVLRLGRLQQLQTAPASDRFTQVLAELSNDDIEPGRRAKLVEYLRLSKEQSQASQTQLREELGQMTRQIGLVEEVLAEQDRFSQTKRTVEPTSLQEVLNQAQRMMPDNAGKDYQLRLDASLEQAPPVLAEPFILAHVLHNLLINAAEAIEVSEAPIGNIEVKAGVDTEADGSQFVHLEVCDNGAGIQPDHRDAIFERGFTTKKGGKGGSGLHWCANSIANLNGQIYATSDGPGHGATLHLILPTAAVVDQAAA